MASYKRTPERRALQCASRGSANRRPAPARRPRLQTCTSRARASTARTVAAHAAAPPPAAPPAAPSPALGAQLQPGDTVRLITRSDCELAVSRYPMFSYDAAAGSGTGRVTDAGLGGSRLAVEFDATTLVVPALTWRTAKVAGVPLPPPFKIAIAPSRLAGWVDVETGEAELDFAADFVFSTGGLYREVSLKVATQLTTEESSGKFRSGRGTRLRGGAGKLCGVARVPRCGDALVDTFLSCPTDAYALLSCELVAA